MNIENAAGWRLKSINIEFMAWGEYKGKYAGKIVFANSESEAFTFNISEEDANKFLSLIRDNVIMSAEKLGARMIQSFSELPSIPKPSSITEIGFEKAE